MEAFHTGRAPAALCGGQGQPPGTPKSKRLPRSHFGPRNDDTGMTKGDTGECQVKQIIALLWWLF